MARARNRELGDDTARCRRTVSNSGGTLAPGNGNVGTLTVAGNLTFQSGSIFLVRPPQYLPLRVEEATSRILAHPMPMGE
jgi:hypothetical protein